MTTFECFKCSGSGRIVAFSGIANGVCFQCKGSGKLTSKQTGVQFTPVAPIVPEATRSTVKQWEFLDRLCDGNSDKFRKVLKQAGSTVPAMQLYVDRATMSKAIDIARAA